MLVPSMLDMADVMNESCFTEEQVFDLGLEGSLVFLVVVPLLGACRVPDEALSHFMAGADEYTAEGMPEHYSEALSGRWTIKRDRLRILPNSWHKYTEFADAVDALSQPQAAPVDEKPWLVVDPKDPIADQPWYTPARYFARQLVLKDSTLLTKKLTLADRVSHSLYSVGIYKRGGKKRHAADTVLKAFTNVVWG